MNASLLKGRSLLLSLLLLVCASGCCYKTNQSGQQHRQPNQQQRWPGQQARQPNQQAGQKPQSNDPVYRHIVGWATSVDTGGNMWGARVVVDTGPEPSTSSGSPRPLHYAQNKISWLGLVRISLAPPRGLEYNPFGPQIWGPITVRISIYLQTEDGKDSGIKEVFYVHPDMWDDETWKTPVWSPKESVYPKERRQYINLRLYDVE